MYPLKRARRILAVIKDNAHDPYLRGRAMQVGGAAIFADSLPRVHNPLGRKGNAGIVAVIIVLGIIGCLLFAVDLADAQTGAYPNGGNARGEVVAVKRGGLTNCAVEVDYVVAGQPYTVKSDSSSILQCRFQVGDGIDVSYKLTEPAGGRPLTGDASIVKWIRVCTTVILAAFIFELLVEVAVLVLGVALVLWGRRFVRHATPVPFDVTLDELQRAWDEPVERRKPRRSLVDTITDRAI